MKALTLKNHTNHRAVLITNDFQKIPKKMNNQIFARLKREHNIKQTQIMFTFSHNHYRPQLKNDLVNYYPIKTKQITLIKKYTTEMIGHCITIIKKTLTHLKPTILSIKQKKTTFTINHRNNPKSEVPTLLATKKPLKGPINHTVPILTITRPNNNLTKILFNYTCHPTTLSFLT